MSNVWKKIGTLRKTVTGKRHLVFNKGVEIAINGERVDLGEFRSAKCFDSLASLDQLESSGKITPENAAKSRSYIEDKNISLDVVIPPTESK